MRNCQICGLEIKDDTRICPFCQSVLMIEKDEPVTGQFHSGRKLSTDWKTERKAESLYPSVRWERRRMQFLFRILFLFFLVAAVVLTGINYLTYHGLWWSAICSGAMFYLYISLHHWTRKQTGHVFNIFIELLGAVALSLLIDVTVGYRGWSVRFAIPSALLAVDAAILVFMILFFESWQRYIILQVFTLLLSIIMLGLSMVDVIGYSVLTLLAAAASVLLFFGTLVFGDRRAEMELKRRFRV